MSHASRASGKPAPVFFRWVALAWIVGVSAAGVAARREPTGVLTGVVTDARSGECIAAAVITLERDDRRTVCGTDGHFTLESLSRGRHWLRVEATGYATVEKAIRLDEGEKRELSFELKPLGRFTIDGCDTCSAPAVIVGAVHDTLGSGVEGVLVRLVDTQHELVTGAEGTFSFADIVDGDYRLAVAAEEYHRDTVHVDVRAGRATTVVVTLRPLRTIDEVTGVVYGTVTDSTGAPIVQAGVSVLNSERTAYSDSSGQYELSALEPGVYSLLASKWGYEAQVVSGIEIAEGSRLRRDFALSSRAVGAFSAEGYGGIRGVVVDEAGQPVSDPTVMLREVDRSVHGDYVGTFSIDSLSSGVYSLVAVAEGYDTSQATDIDVWDGEMSTVSLTLRRAVASPDELQAPPDKGLVTGIVVDAEKQEPLAGVEVSVQGARIDKAVTDLSGRYVLPAVPEGQVRLEFSHAGYETKIVDGVASVKGQVTVQDALLSVSGVSQMDRISVRAPAVRSTGAALLRERQDAISFTDAVGAQEMSRAGASTAADAMRSVTGATIVGGKYVLIRGLPERYTMTTINGCRLPSPDPDRKAVNMDIFPAGVIENITTHKTFTPDLPGGFAGGVVDIHTKPFPDKFTLSVGASVGIDGKATFNESFLTYEGGDLDWLGLDDGSRDRPEILTQYDKRTIERLYGVATRNWDSESTSRRLNDPNDHIMDTIALINEIATSLDTAMIPYETTAPPNQSYTFSTGNTFIVLDRPLGVRLGLSYSNSYSLSRNDISRSFNDFTAWVDTGSHRVEPYDDFRVTKAANKVRWGVLGTGAYRVSEDHEVQANYLYTHSGADEVKIVDGLFGYYEHDGYNFRRLHFTERSLSYVQPNGKHRLYLGARPLDLLWNGSYTYSQQEEPDTRDSYHFRSTSDDGTVQYQMEPNLGDAVHRWRNLTERGGSFDARAVLPFYQWTGDSGTAFVGGAWFGKRRNLSEFRYTYALQSYFDALRDASIRPESLISPSHLGVRRSDTTLTGYARGMRVEATSQADAQWEGTLHMFAVYGFVQLPLFARLSAALGVRYERTDLFGWTTVEEFQVDSTKAVLDDHDMLPSISLTWRLRDEMNVRAAYGRTAIRPSMREKAAYVEEDFLGGPSYVGNPDLKSSQVDNVDLRWEWYMKPGELFAASAYFKHVDQPIEITFFSSTNDIRMPANTSNDATIWGMEFEARKQLDMWRWSRHFSVSGNLTLARSRVDLDEKSRKLESYFPDQEPHRPFQGQSPVVVNVFLGYDNPDVGTNLNLVYNVFGERLGEINNRNVPWEWECTRHMLDATARQDIGNRFAVKAKVSNILGSDKKFVHYYADQELLVREEKIARTYSLGLQLSF